MNMKEILKTPRLEIRPYKESDIPALMRILADKVIARTFILPDYETFKEYEALAKKLMAYSYSDEHFERGIYRGDTLVGFVNDVEIAEEAVEMGYVIHPDFQGQGYATEMFRAVIAELFEGGFRKVKTAAFEGNTASIRVMEKCGMSKTDFCSFIEHQGERKKMRLLRDN